jgi:hypothetical protein
MIKNKPKKGNIEVYADEYNNTKAISPDELIIYVGTVVEDVNTKQLKVGSGIPKKLGVIISQQQNRIDTLEKELSELKYSYRKNMKMLVDIIGVLTSQTQLNNMNINDIKQNLEDINNEK